MRLRCPAYLLYLLPAAFVAALQPQHPLFPSVDDIDNLVVQPALIDSPARLPRINFAALDGEREDVGYDWRSQIPRSDEMMLKKLAVSGPSDKRVNIMFFADGYTLEEEDKFTRDAQKLAGDIVTDGPLAHVAHLVNVWGVFLPSVQSGVGAHSVPLDGAAFGLYRPGSELRAVYVQRPRRARAACRYWRESEAGGAGCDQAVLLGNDPLYGGLGGEFTIITASELNGPLVLRHELGHSLIPVGEEYEGGYAYFGANSDKPRRIGQLKWSRFLTNPGDPRIEDVRVPLQVYPWHDLDEADYNISFTSSSGDYPTALLRASVSSIPAASHLSLQLNGVALNVTNGFPESWGTSHDRRWIEIPLDDEPFASGQVNVITVALTQEGRAAKAGQGGKLISSLEVMQYGGAGRFNGTKGFVGAFPTYSIDGEVTLRPTNEECLMRKVNHPTFCPVCSDALERSLRAKIAKKQHKSSSP